MYESVCENNTDILDLDIMYENIEYNQEIKSLEEKIELISNLSYIYEAEDEIEKQKEEQKVRAKASRAARRSGKSMRTEGKVSKATSKTREARSSKKIAAVKKRTRS